MIPEHKWVPIAPGFTKYDSGKAVYVQDIRTGKCVAAGDYQPMGFLFMAAQAEGLACTSARERQEAALTAAREVGEEIERRRKGG